MRASPPAIDVGDPPGPLAILRGHLSPRPGRLSDTLRLVMMVLASVTVSEVFRIPEAALSAYVVLFVSRGEAASTVMTAALAGLAVLLAVLMTIAVFTLSLAEPALRIPMVAATTFLAMFLSRTSPLGPVFFAAGFIIAYGLTLGDQVLQLSLMPGSVANTPEFELPELAFFPPEEALVHFLLWLGLVVGMPVGLVIAANLLIGRDPAILLRAALAERLAAASRFCAGEPGSEHELSKLAREGTAELAKLQHLSSLLRRGESSFFTVSLVQSVGHLCVVLLAFSRLPDARTPAILHAAGRRCTAAERAVRERSAPAYRSSAGDEVPAAEATGPLGAGISRVLDGIEASLTSTQVLPAPAASSVARSPRRLLVADAFTNRAHTRFAFKVTLAVMLCYIGESLADWPGIHTCIITCFFVSLATVGETVHKATLRIAGCAVGAALGIGTILLLMPVMTNLDELLAVVAVVTFLAGWIATGSERISYAGWQIALAFYLTTLQGFGPTLDMQTARDRIVGIVIGDLVVFAVFTTIWPVRVSDLVRANLARAVEQLRAILLSSAVETGLPAETVALEQAFMQAILQARDLLVNDPYERPRAARAPRPIDAHVLTRTQALIVPLSAIVDLAADPAWPGVPQPISGPIGAYHRALAEWFGRCAAWVRSGAGAEDIVASLPAPPTVGGEADPANARDVAGHLRARTVWYRLLDGDISAILEEVGPRSSFTSTSRATLASS